MVTSRKEVSTVLGVSLYWGKGWIRCY